MNADSFVLSLSFLAILGGLGILLGSEAIGASEMFVIVGGAVSLFGVGILTVTVMRLPGSPEGAEH